MDSVEDRKKRLGQNFSQKLFPHREKFFVSFAVTAPFSRNPSFVFDRKLGGRKDESAKKS
jgi:hypothetical protein